MEINANTLNAVTPSPTQQPNVKNELNNEDPDAILSSESTVSVSAEARNVAEQDINTPSAQTTTEEQAKQLVNEFQDAAKNDSNLTLKSQSSDVTSEVVGRLLG